jgi:hypothetical protein
VIAREGLLGRGAKARAAVLTLAIGVYRVAGGHVKPVRLRLVRRARRLLLRRKVLAANATVTMRGSTGAIQSSHAAITLRLARRR